MEELKLKYEIKTYKRQNKAAPPEAKEIHPLGKFPIMTVESAATSKPLVLAESGLIIEYLIGHYGPRLVPKQFVEGKEGRLGGETEEWMRYKYYMHYPEGTLMPYLVLVLLLNSMLIAFFFQFSSPLLKLCSVIKTSVPFFIKPIAKLITGAIESNYLRPNLKTNFDFLESQIASSPDQGEYLCGSTLTGADIFMSFPLIAAKGRTAFQKETYPKLWAYVDRIEAHEAFKRAVEKIIEIEGSYDPAV